MKRCLIGNTTFLIFISTMPHSVRTWPKWGTVVQWLSIIMYHVCYVCFFSRKLIRYTIGRLFSHMNCFVFFLLWPFMANYAVMVALIVESCMVVYNCLHLLHTMYEHWLSYHICLFFIRFEVKLTKKLQVYIIHGFKTTFFKIYR